MAPRTQERFAPGEPHEPAAAATGRRETRGRSAGTSGGERQDREREFATGLARAFGGAIFFSMPLLMTMEMWWLGFYMSRGRLALFMAVFIPILFGLSRYAGFKPTAGWKDDAVDVGVAYLVGLVTAAVTLWMLGVLSFAEPVDEVVGKIALEAVPASVGAMVARGQLGGGEGEEKQRREGAGYAGTLFIMIAGAIFFAFNVAPTEEMILIAFKLTAWKAIVLLLASLAMMHAFVYAVEFKGQVRPPKGTPIWSLFVRFTVVGYVLSLLVSAYVLWSIGRFEHSGWTYIVMSTIVLGFPASLGAAAARLIL